MDIATIRTAGKSGLSTVFFNPAEQRMRGIWRLLIQGGLFFGGVYLFQTIIGMVIGIILTMSGVNVQDQQAIFTGHAFELIRLLITLTTLAIAFLSCSFAARRLDKRPFQNYGFRFSRRWWMDLGFGLFLGAFLMLCIFLAERSAGWVQATSRPLDGWAWLVILSNLIVYIAVGITEELFSRGYQIRNMSETLNIRRRHPRLAIMIAYLVTSSLFGLLHFANPNSSPTSNLLLMAAGVLMGLGYVLTGELGLSIGLHITWNFFQGIVFGFPVSGNINSVSIIQIQQGGPSLWTGGAFGPEAGLVGLAAVIVGMLLILGWVQLSHRHVALPATLAEYSNVAS